MILAHVRDDEPWVHELPFGELSDVFMDVPEDGKLVIPLF